MDSNRSSREAALLVFVVFLLGVLLGGVADHMWGYVVFGHARTQIVTQRPKQEVMQEFTKEMHLTGDQQAQLSTIIDETRSRWRSLYAPLESQHEQIRMESRAKIRAMLTPEQVPAFDSYMKELDQRRREQKAREAADR
jgi:Spy/CpxP family protein refolding chaperone